MLHPYKNSIPAIHETCFIAPGAAVIGEVAIGKNSSVWFNTVLRGDMAPIIIGENTNIQDSCVLHCVHNRKVEIGDTVTVGHGAILHSCTIGDNCLVGMGAIILDGVEIGKNCIVGAGSLITPNTIVPEGSLVLGSPAKVKRPLTQEEMENIQRNAEAYIKLVQDYTDSQL